MPDTPPEPTPPEDDDLGWVEVQSTCVRRMWYDEFTGRLWLVFVEGNGKPYPFDGFPKQKWKLWLAAPSKGKFFHAHVKDRYRAAGY